jgi:hypothetical protein
MTKFDFDFYQLKLKIHHIILLSKKNINITQNSFPEAQETAP